MELIMLFWSWEGIENALYELFCHSNGQSWLAQSSVWENPFSFWETLDVLSWGTTSTTTAALTGTRSQANRTRESKEIRWPHVGLNKNRSPQHKTSISQLKLSEMTVCNHKYLHSVESSAIKTRMSKYNKITGTLKIRILKLSPLKKNVLHNSLERKF